MGLRILTGRTRCNASLSEEPGAGIPHAGICEGGVRATGRPYLDSRPHPFSDFLLKARVHIQVGDKPDIDRKDMSEILSGHLDNAYSNIRISKGQRENVGLLNIDSARSVVFHEYMHRWGLYDEYCTAHAPDMGLPNYRDIYEKEMGNAARTR
jgi:hypothetical protein